MGAQEAKLDTSGDRVDAGGQAGNEYINTLEEYKAKTGDDSGTSLETMVEIQIGMTEAQTKYQTQSGLPNSASKTVNQIAKKINQQ